MNDPLRDLHGYLLKRASSAALKSLNDRLATFALRHTELSLLVLIRANPGITQSQAGRMLDIQRANVVPLIARLEKRGLLQRTPVDGRSQAIRLTASGRVLTKKSFAVVQACEEQLVEQVPAELRQAVLPILRALCQGAAE